MAKKKTSASARAGRKPRKKRPAALEMSDLAPVPVDSIPHSFDLTTVQQLRSISMPIRISILREMAAQPLTTKQVAERLGEPITKLYHHVDALAKAGLLTLVREVRKRGTTEKYFRAVAQRFRADELCFSDETQMSERMRVIIKMLDRTKHAMLQIAAGRDSPASNAIAASCNVSASWPELQRLMDQLTKTIATWDKKRQRSSKAAKRSSLDDPKNTSQVSIFIHPEQVALT
jgi:DNA-binding transcriptional ArsR family regulator